VALTASASPACNATTNPPVKYHLGAALEDTTNGALSQDADYNSVSPSDGYQTCTGSGSGGFIGLSTSCNSSGTYTTDGCYDVTP
jgi:hypothetical protein